MTPAQYNQELNSALQVLHRLNTPQEDAAVEDLLALLKYSDSGLRHAISTVAKCPDPSTRNPLIRTMQSYAKTAPEPESFPVHEEFVYRGCYVSPVEAQVLGLIALGTETSMWAHKKGTRSIYVAATRSRAIAIEHARRFGRGGFVYTLRSMGAICCRSWFAPLDEILAVEDEVVFIRRVPPSQIVSVVHESAC